MPPRNRKSPSAKRTGSKKSSGSGVIWIVLIALFGLGAWLYFNQSETEAPRKTLSKTATEKRALEMLKEHPSAEVFDVQEDKKKSP